MAKLVTLWVARGGKTFASEKEAIEYEFKIEAAEKLIEYFQKFEFSDHSTSKDLAKFILFNPKSLYEAIKKLGDVDAIPASEKGPE